MEKIYGAVSDLTKYALATDHVATDDVIYTVNSLLGALGIDDYPGNKEEIIEGAGRLSRAGIEDGTLLEGILSEILEYASAKGMLDGSSVVMRDLFDTKIMGILTPRQRQRTGIMTSHAIPIISAATGSQGTEGGKLRPSTASWTSPLIFPNPRRTLKRSRLQEMPRRAAIPSASFALKTRDILAE